MLNPGRRFTFWKTKNFIKDKVVMTTRQDPERDVYYWVPGNEWGYWLSLNDEKYPLEISSYELISEGWKSL